MMKQTLTTITRQFKMPNVQADEIETNSSKLRLIPEEQTALYREANAKMLNKRLRKMLELL